MARGVSGPGPPACYARGRPDGQLRIAEPHLPYSQPDGCPATLHLLTGRRLRARLDSSKCRLDPRPASPCVGKRPFSPPNVYTVYTGHCCCRHHDWFSVPENVTFVTSCPLGVLHTPAIATRSQKARAGPRGLEQARAPAYPVAGTDFALNRPPFSPPHKPLIESRSL